MKHIVKVASLSNIGDVRPIIAMDNDGNLKWESVATPQIEVVDLGLSVLWTTMNVGADTSVGYGNYYAWGETDARIITESGDGITCSPSCDWNNYEHGSDWNKLTKYCPTNKSDYWDGQGSPDGLTTLVTTDDIATVELGSNYRMPTKAEFEELLSGTTQERVSDYNGSGIDGMLFTSSTNGNVMFVPNSGYCYESSGEYYGTGFALWSSAVNADSPNGAWRLRLEDEDDTPYVNYDDRCCGCPVRAVTESSN